MTFEDWLNELEVYSTRRERMIEGLMTYRDDTEFVLKWMRAAYNEGVKAANDSKQKLPPDYAPPKYPTGPVPWPNPGMPNTSAGRQCHKCGLSFSSASGYVCMDNHCPTFLKVTSQTYNTSTLLNENTNWD